MVSGVRHLCSLCGETTVKPDCVDTGKDQAPLGGLAVPSLPPSACCPSFLGALGSPHHTLILLLQGRVLVRSQGANREEGQTPRQPGPCDAPARWAGRGSGVLTQPLSCYKLPIQGGGQHNEGTVSPLVGCPNTVPAQTQRRCSTRWLWRGRACGEEGQTLLQRPGD